MLARAGRELARAARPPSPIAKPVSRALGFHPLRATIHAELRKHSAVRAARVRSALAVDTPRRAESRLFAVMSGRDQADPKKTVDFRRPGSARFLQRPVRWPAVATSPRKELIHALPWTWRTTNPHLWQNHGLQFVISAFMGGAATEERQ